MEEFLTAIWPGWEEYAIVPLILYGITVLATVLKTPKEDANPIYVIAYRVISFIAMNIGDAKNADDVAAGRTLNYNSTKKCDTNKTLLVLVMAASLFATGCALKNLEPHEQGIAIAQELTEAYYILEEQYFDLPQETQEQVAPLLNTYRKTLVLLRDSASLWYKTQTKPVDFDELSNSIAYLINDIKVLIEAKIE